MLSKKKPMKKVHSIFTITFFGISSLLAQTQETTVTPSKDNSIYQEGELSNGAGERLFCGVTREGNIRRALIKFDLTDEVPEGTTVDSAHLILVPSLVKTNGTTVTIHMLSSDWGEGTADAEGPEGQGAPASDEDATWTKSFFNGDPWVKAGGDFSFDILASNQVNMGTDALFASPMLTGAVNAWIEDPAQNHGVILIGDETKNPTGVRFNSREFSDFETWPKLVLFYQGATSSVPGKMGAHNMRIYQDQNSPALMIRNDFGPVNSRVELYSITGSIIFSGERYLTVGENRIVTDLDASGIYIYRVISGAGMLSGKLIIQSR